MAHVGLTPQAVNIFGGYKVQGRGDAADRVLRDAQAVTDAGAFSIVLEKVTEPLARTVTEKLAIPTIGEHDTTVLMHNDGVAQGLSEMPFMQDVARWGVLTIGTGLGNARFTMRKTTPRTRDKDKDEKKGKEKEKEKDKPKEKEKAKDKKDKEKA